jgi:cytochrome c556
MQPLPINQPKEGFMKLPATVLLAAALLASAGAAQAQFRTPQDAIDYRQGAFNVMGNHFGRVGAMATGRVPFDAAAVQQNMAIIMTISRLPWAGFTPETQGLPSKAKPVVWTERPRFDAAAQDALRALTALNAAAMTNNLDAVRRAFSETAASCKACHDNFRD